MTGGQGWLLRRYQPGDRPPQPLRTFQNTWRARCEGEWQRAFYMFSFSAPLFQRLRQRVCCAVCGEPAQQTPT